MSNTVHTHTEANKLRKVYITSLVVVTNKVVLIVVMSNKLAFILSCWLCVELNGAI